MVFFLNKLLYSCKYIFVHTILCVANSSDENYFVYVYWPTRLNKNKISHLQVTDLYDDIDLSDANQKDLLSSEDLHPAKRARLDINYSIGPAGTFQSLNGSQQPQQNRRKMTLVNRIV